MYILYLVFSVGEFEYFFKFIFEFWVVKFWFKIIVDSLV